MADKKLKIVRSDSPEALKLLQNSAEKEALRLADEASNRSNVNWTDFVAPVGGGLLGYNLVSSLLDKPEDEKRKESVWSKALRELASIGAGAAGAYGGYLLSKKAQAAPEVLWDLEKNQWVSAENADPNGIYSDLIGENRDAKNAWKWPWVTVGGINAATSLYPMWRAFVRTGQWRRGGLSKEVMGPNGAQTVTLPENNKAIAQQQENVSNIAEALNNDKDKMEQHNAAVDINKVQNKYQKKVNDSNNVAKNKAYAADMKAYASGGTKKMPTAPVTPDFVPAPNPPAPRLSGYTITDLNNAKATLKRTLGRRAARHWLTTLAQWLLSGFSFSKGYNNVSEEARTDALLRERGINPDNVQ